MFCVLLSLILLEACAGMEKKPMESSLSNNEQSQRAVHDVAKKKALGESGNYVTTVIYCDWPPFPDTISVGSASDKTDKFSIQFKQVTFSKLSSAFGLLFQIDLDSQIVQLILRLGKAHINGSYCLSTPSSPNKIYHDFEVNLFVDLMYTHNMKFHFDNEQKISFGKAENRRLLYNKVKGRYVNVPSPLAEEVNGYLSPVLLEAIVEKIHAEVSTKINIDNISHRIKSENALRSRNLIAGRLQKAIEHAFSGMRLNSFSVFYVDKTNFNRIIQNFDVTLPTLDLQDFNTFILDDFKSSFVGDNVHTKVVFKLTSPLAIIGIEYCNRSDPLAQKHTANVEYRISDVSYNLELVAKPETKTIEVAKVDGHLSGVSLATSQGLYGDERDLLASHLIPYIEEYFPNLVQYALSIYIKGLAIEGGIAHQVFE